MNVRVSKIGIAIFSLSLVLLVAAYPAGAQSGDTTLVEVDVQEAASTFMLTVTAESDLELASDGHVVMKGLFDKEEKLQRISALVSTTQDYTETTCGEETAETVGDEDGDHARVGVKGGFPCLMGLYGSQIEDVSASTNPGDAWVGAGTLASVETGHDHGAFESLTIGVAYSEGTVFPMPDGADEVSYQFLVTLPEAVELTEQSLLSGPSVHLEFEGQGIQYDWETSDSGFSIWADEMSPGGVHTPFARAYQTLPFFCGFGGGCAQVTLDSGNRLYTAMGPTWGGYWNAHDHVTNLGCLDCTRPFPNIASGIYGLQGTERRSTCVFCPAIGTGGAAFEPKIMRAGQDTPGDYLFWVDTYVGTGTQDLLTVGLMDELPSPSAS